MGHHDSCDQWPMTYTQVIRVRVICNDRITIWPITHLTHDPWPSTRVTRVRSRVTSDDPDPCEQLTMTHLTRDPWPGTRVIRVRSWVGADDRDPCDPSNNWSMTHLTRDPLSGTLKRASVDFDYISIHRTTNSLTNVCIKTSTHCRTFSTWDSQTTLGFRTKLYSNIPTETP